MDSDFYGRKNLEDQKKLVAKDAKPITNFVSVSDGNHMTISDYYSDDGIPYYRGSDIYNFFIEQASNALRIEKRIFETPNMKRSHLKKGDVLMSIVGAIIGNVSLVKTDSDATCSCKLAIMRPQNIQPEFFAIYLKSTYGQNQIQKFKRGAAQTGLILEDFEQLLIPSFSENLKSKIVELVNLAFSLIEKSKSVYSKSEQTLLEAVGLADFKPSTQNTNIKTFAQSFGNSGRLDAEYYQPKYEQVVAKVKYQPYDILANIVTINKSIEPGSDAYADEGLPFIRVSDYSKQGLTTPDKYLSDEFYLANKSLLEGLKPKAGTILFSKDGSVGTAYLLRQDLEGVTSGAILHLNIKREDVLPEYLTLTLNSKLVQMQAERDAGGSIILHWRVGEIENVVVPIVDMNIQTQISELIKESFTLKAESERLLEVAKRAVEIGIELDEETAVQYINKNSH